MGAVAGGDQRRSGWQSGLRHTPRIESIARCELFGTIPEMALITENGLRFLAFSTTEEQPQWHLIDRRGDLPRLFTVKARALHLCDSSKPDA